MSVSGRLLRRVGGTWFLVSIIGLGCAQEAPPPSSPADSANTDQGRDGSSETGLSASGAPLSGETSPATEPELPDPAKLVGEICERTCVRVDQECNPKAAKFCRASCKDYVNGTERCPVEIHGALACQENAESFRLCANIADEACTQLFLKMVECREGRVEPRVWGDTARPKAEDPAAGLVAFAVPGFNITQLMPEPVTVKSQSPLSAEAMEAGEPGRFVIDEAPIEGKKLSAANELRTVTKYVGLACEPKLKLHGRFESFGAAHVRFDTVCKGGLEYHGVAHFYPERVLFVSHIAKAADGLSDARRDAFLFGFKGK